MSLEFDTGASLDDADGAIDSDEVVEESTFIADDGAPLFVDPATIEPEPESTLGPPKKGICRECGKKAWDGRAFYCEEHLHLRDERKTSNVVGGLTRPRTGGTPSDATVKKRNVAALKKSILGANEWIVKGSQYLSGVPDGLLDADGVQYVHPETGMQTVVQFNPHIRQLFEVQDKEAELVANAMVAFADSPTGKTISIFAEKAAPILTLALAAGVVVKHAMGINQLKAIMQQLNGASQPNKQAETDRNQPVSDDGPTRLDLNEPMEGAA